MVSLGHSVSIRLKNPTKTPGELRPKPTAVGRYLAAAATGPY